MRYAIYDGDGAISNTIVCDDPAFAAEIGAVEYPYPARAHTPVADEYISGSEALYILLGGNNYD